MVLIPTYYENCTYIRYVRMLLIRSSVTVSDPCSADLDKFNISHSLCYIALVHSMWFYLFECQMLYIEKNKRMPRHAKAPFHPTTNHSKAAIPCKKSII